MGIGHTDDFKQEAVKVALTSALPRRRVASDLGVGFSTLCGVMQVTARGFSQMADATDE